LTPGDDGSPSTTGSDLPERIGRYRLGRVLGRGGFAVVIKAWDEGLDSAVAIKILERRFSDDPDVRRRFVNEARVLRRVDASNVVSVHDVGELDDSRPFFVMQFADGGVLDDRIPTEPGIVDEPSIRAIVASLHLGLAALHAVDVIHRDVKPGNLLITGAAPGVGETTTSRRHGLLAPGERILVGDLGLAKVNDEASTGPTILGGSLHFRAPEQARLGAEVTPATDVFAATAVLWNLLTGEPPPPPDEVDRALGGVHRAWREFFVTGLASDARSRFRTMDAWAASASASISSSDAALGFTPTGGGAVCPYKGLAAFQPDDADFFFGRERLVDQLIAGLQSSSTLVIGGPSGSGKSSLLRAGLVPAVQRGALPGSQQWPILLFTPGSQPLRELHHQLRQIPEFCDREITLADLRTDPSIVGSAAEATRGALVAVDQLEEIFTSTADEAAAFVAVLEALAAPQHGRIRVALAVRADFYSACALHSWLAETITRNGVLVGPMNRAELHQAIEAPARRAGLRLEPGLADEILDQTPRDVGALPLVAHALMETWIRRRDDELTVNGLQAAGGVGGALAQRADQTYDGLVPDRRELMRTLFLDLVNPGEGTPDTRRRVTWDELGDDPAVHNLITELADARLVSVDDETIAVAHEVLISTWPRLRLWIEDARDDLRLRGRIERAAAAWIAESRDPALLYRGTPLATATEWRDSARLSADQAEFLDESQRVSDAEEAARTQARHRSQRIRRVAVSALAVFATVAVAASVIALYGLRRAQENEQEASDRFLSLLANQSQSIVEIDPLVGVLLASEGVARRDPPSAAAQRLVVDARLALAAGGIVPAGAPIAVPSGKIIAMRPSGTSFAVGDRSGLITVFSVETREPIADLVGHEAGIESAAYSPDGAFLATGDGGGDIIIWDLSSLDPDERADVVESPTMSVGSTVWGLAFSPDGRELAVSTEDGTVRIVDLAVGGFDVRLIVDDPMQDFLSVAFSPSGGRLAIGAGTGQLQIWDRDSDKVSPLGVGHTSDVWQVSFDGDERRLVSVSSNETKVWDVTTGAELATLFLASVESGQIDRIEAATLLPDDRVVGGGSDGGLWLTDLPSGNEPETVAPPLRTHDDKVARTGVVRSHDGSLLASLADDETVRLWEVVQPGEPAPVVADVAADGFGLAVDAAAGLVAVGDDAGTVHVVDAGSGSVAATLSGHEGRVFGVAFTDAGLVTGDQAGRLRLWSDEGQVVIEIDGHDDAVNSVATDPDGEVVVSASEDGSVRFWQASSLEPLTDPLGAGSGAATMATFLPDGELVVASYWSGEVKFWDPTGGSARSTFVADVNSLLGIAVSPDGEFLAAASAEEHTLVFDLDEARRGGTPEPLHRLTPESRGATGVAFGADDVLFTSNKAGGVRLWNPRTGDPISPPFELYERDPWRIVVEPGSSVAWVAGSGGALRRIDLIDRPTNCTITDLAADAPTLDTYLNGEGREGC